MIRATHLRKTFGRLAAVDDLSFRQAPGEALALWGPNGAGKTTVIRCVLGLLRFRGDITVNGLDIRRAGKRCRLAIGYVPQELSFHADLRVAEALLFYARLKRVSRQRPAEVLDEVGLSGQARKRIGELSGGMKQRLALAVALLADPPILILDELTSNLDRAAQSAFLSMLCRQKDKGKTVLFASHRADEVELLADRVLLLADGRLSASCKPAQLAEAAGLRCTLALRVGEASMARAVETLRRHHYPVTSNGKGLLVEVAVSRKAEPIQALARDSIDVLDFDVAGDRPAGGEGGPR